MKSNSVNYITEYLILTLTILSLCFLTACSDPSKEQDNKVKAYLRELYLDEFEAELKQEGDEPYYEAYPVAYPDVIFRVENNDSKSQSLYTSPFKDDYAQQLLLKTAQRLGLTIEEGVSPKDVIVKYPDYESIDDIAEKVEEFVTICRNSNAFPSYSGSLTVLPGFTDDMAFPGCLISLDNRTRSMNPDDLILDSGIGNLRQETLAEQLKYYHIYSFYNYIIPEQQVSFPPEDMENYIQLSTGAMSTADHGDKTDYPYVDMTDHENPSAYFFGGTSDFLTIGGAYQILSSEGMVTQIGNNSFTAAGNSLTVTFTVEFGDRGASYSWSCVDAQGNALPEWESAGYTHITPNVIEEITGKKLFPMSLNEFRLMVEELRENPVPLSTPRNVGSVNFTVLSTKITDRLEAGHYYYEPTEGATFLIVRLSAVNQGENDAELFQSILYSSNNFYRGVISDSDGNFYNTVKVDWGDLDTFDVKIKPGETAEGDVIFQIPSNKANALIELVLTIVDDSEEKAAFLLQ